jgi:hypothetical protein
MCVGAVLHLRTFRFLGLSSLLRNATLRVDTCWRCNTLQIIGGVSQTQCIVGNTKPIPVVARYKACVCGRLFVGVAGSNPIGGMGVFCECCVLEVSATG